MCLEFGPVRRDSVRPMKRTSLFNTTAFKLPSRPPEVGLTWTGIYILAFYLVMFSDTFFSDI